MARLRVADGLPWFATKEPGHLSKVVSMAWIELTGLELEGKRNERDQERPSRRRCDL